VPAPRLSGMNESAVIVFGVVVLLALVIFVTRRMSRRGPARARTDGGPAPGPTTDELTARASYALVETDDAVRTSEQELGFAIARFGERAAAAFSAALQSARAELSAAFTLRQRLDEIPGDEATTRSYLADISVHCSEANRLLDEHAEAFDRLQDPAARAPLLVAEVDAHAVQQSARVSNSRQVLEKLAAKYTPDGVLAVVTNPDQAADRLEFAADSLAGARKELADGQSGQAAVLLQAAESGTDQATDLLNGVEHSEAELTQAASALPSALREVDAEIAEAAELPAGRLRDERASLVARAQTIAADVRAKQAAGPFDALAALRDVQQADAALDRALASVREEQTRRERAMAVLDQAMLVARSSVTAAEDFIATRRGAVGATARTRQAEAQRRFRQAIGYGQHDPEAALTEAQRADALAQDARSVAEQDVTRFDYGGAAGPDHIDGAGGVGGLGGALLGGILIDSPPGGRRADGSGHGDRSGHGHCTESAPGHSTESASGGEFGRGGIGPSSFGGSGTRGRHTVNGSF
jgi:hypothetical protein